VEFFTLLIDHSFASTVDISYNSIALGGQMLDQSDK
jgi:hypothetical protein